MRDLARAMSGKDPFRANGRVGQCERTRSNRAELPQVEAEAG